MKDLFYFRFILIIFTHIFIKSTSSTSFTHKNALTKASSISIATKSMQLKQFLYENNNNNNNNNNNVQQQLKELNKFKVNLRKSNSSTYDSDYKENLIKLIENFLLKHLKKIMNKKYLNKKQEQEQEEMEIQTEEQEESQSEISDEENLNKQLIDYEQEQKFTTLNNNNNNLSVKNSSRSPSSLHPSANKTLPTTQQSTDLSKIESFFNSSSIIVNGLHNLNVNKFKNQNVTRKSSSGFDFSDEILILKEKIHYYKNYFFNFISIVIFLSTLCLILLISSFICCIMYCKQRAHLKYLSENEFFTYYNRHLPVIASVSSFSLDAATPNNNKNCNDSSAISITNKKEGKNMYTLSGSRLELNNSSYHNHNQSSTNCLINKSNNNMNANSNHSISIMSSANTHLNNKLSTHLFGNKSSLTLYNNSKTQTNPNDHTVASSFTHLPMKCKENSQAELVSSTGHNKLVKSQHELINSIVSNQNLSRSQEHYGHHEVLNRNDEQIQEEQEDEEDLDIVLENDLLCNQLIENCEKYLFFKSLEANLVKQDSMNKNNLPRIKMDSTLVETNKNLIREEDLPINQVVRNESISKSRAMATLNQEQVLNYPRQVLIQNRNLFQQQQQQLPQPQITTHQTKTTHINNYNIPNSNCIQNEQATSSSSPSFIRDRYYQILRDQVFPFLQKPPVNSLHINQSPKEIQNINNDVLY